MASSESSDECEEEPRSEFGNERFLGRDNPNPLLGTRTPTSTSPPIHRHDSSNKDPEHRQNNHSRRSRNRSKSSSQAADQKHAWAEGIAHQKPLLESIASLRKSVEAYEKEADVREWEKVSQDHEDILSLQRRATEASQNASLNEGKVKVIGKFFKFVGKFSTVALEYTKLLDVLMNHWPEYVSLAWGSIKILLVANVNNAKLKEKVEQYLVKIGEQLGLVNLLIYSVPTQKMIEAVALLYASFSKFLTKALKYYRRCRFSRAIGAFAFPWDIKLQPIVDMINDQLEYIRMLADAGHTQDTGHYRSSTLLASYLRTQACLTIVTAGPLTEELLKLQTRQFLELLRNEQRDTHQDVNKMKDEMQQGLQELFKNFNAVWVQKFDELQQAVSPQQEAFSPEREDPPESTNLTTDMVKSKDELLQSRDSVFPKLFIFAQREQQLRARSRNLCASDYQHSVGLLRHEEMKAWFEGNISKILWVNSWITGSADWASSFALNLIDHAVQLPYVTTLVHFCQRHSAPVPSTTAADIVRSFIFQALERHFTRIGCDASQRSIDQCNLAEDSIDALWGMLQNILVEANARCTWVIIDTIDMLEKGESEVLLGLVDSLDRQSSRCSKIFITSRNAGPSKSLSPSSVNGASFHTRSATITMPRARHRALSTMWAKHSRRPGRLPDNLDHDDFHDGETGLPASLGMNADVDRQDDPDELDSLGSFAREDNFASSDDDEESLRLVDQRPPATQLQRNKESFLGDSDLDFSLEEAPDGNSEYSSGASEDSDGDDYCAPSVQPQTGQETVSLDEVNWNSDTDSP